MKILKWKAPLQFINSQKMHSNSQTHQLYLVEFDTLELGYPSTQMIWGLMTLAKGGAAYCRQEQWEKNREKEAVMFSGDKSSGGNTSQLPYLPTGWNFMCMMLPKVGVWWKCPSESQLEFQLPRGLSLRQRQAASVFK